MALIIAELCRNHNGDRDILRRMIWEAAEAGASYAKIQSMTPDELTFREEFEQGERPYAKELDALRRTCLSDDDHYWFLEECARACIKPLTTVFSRSRIPFIAQLLWEKTLGRKEVKVASFDCASFPMLCELRAVFDHLYVSTGATTDDEVEQAAAVLKGHSFTFFHCVSIYPTPLERVNLRRMERLRRFTPLVGFSDHSPGTGPNALKASICALMMGASVIERHFTVLDRTLTRDGPVSLDKRQLVELVRFARMEPAEVKEYVEREIPEFPMMLGDGRSVLSTQEQSVRAYQRGRFASKVGGRVKYNWED